VSAAPFAFLEPTPGSQLSELTEACPRVTPPAGCHTHTATVQPIIATYGTPSDAIDSDASSTVNSFSSGGLDGPGKHIFDGVGADEEHRFIGSALLSTVFNGCMILSGGCKRWMSISYLGQVQSKCATLADI